MQPCHYPKYGLDNIYLLNGYKLVEKNGIQTVRLKDENSYIKSAIGLSIASWQNTRPLTGTQIRFLYKDIIFLRDDINSNDLWLKILRTTPEQLKRWLNDKEIMPYEKELILRLRYIEGRVSELTHQIYVGEMVERLGRYRPDHHPEEPPPNIYLEWIESHNGDYYWKQNHDYSTN